MNEEHNLGILVRDATGRNHSACRIKTEVTTNELILFSMEFDDPYTDDQTSFSVYLSPVDMNFLGTRLKQEAESLNESQCKKDTEIKKLKRMNNNLSLKIQRAKEELL